MRLAARLGVNVRRATGNDEQAGEVALPLIDRIVLYIDDLDRCPPSRVVEVLEAVHLILALPLFVVVVAVDPRWLLQSLRLHYSELLAGALREQEHPPTAQQAAESWNQRQDEVGTGTEAAWESTPLNYLEKIIQIPFTLRPMGRKGVESLVTKLLPVKTDDVPEGVPDREVRVPTVEAEGTRAEWTRSQTLRAVGRPRSTRSAAAPTALLAPAPSPPSLELTNQEREFAINAGCILRTPRSVKKFTNLYRLVRARLTEESAELDTFLDAEGGDIAEYQAVVILLAVIIAFPDEASTFFLGIGDLQAEAEEDRRPWRDYIEELRERRGGRWHELVAFVDDVTAEAIGDATATREPFRRWALEISRYSFATGQEVFSRAVNMSRSRDHLGSRSPRLIVQVATQAFECELGRHHHTSCSARAFA